MLNKDIIKKLDITLQFVPKQGTLLEIGCYPFIITKELMKRGYDICGIDLTKNIGLNVKKCNIETQKFPFPKNTFDVVLMMEVIEHLGTDPLHPLQESYRVLKTDGTFVLTTPNILRLHNIKTIIFEGKQLETLKSLSQKYITSLNYIGHIREYTRNELIELLTFCKFTNISYRMYEPSHNILTKIISFFLPMLKTNIIITCRKGE